MYLIRDIYDFLSILDDIFIDIKFNGSLACIIDEFDFDKRVHISNQQKKYPNLITKEIIHAISSEILGINVSS